MSLTLTEVATRMAKQGISPVDIANILEVPVDDVVNLGIQPETGRSSIDDISSAMEGIVWLVYEEAKRTMRVGSPAQKNFLMRLVIGYLMRTLAVQTPSAVIDLQDEFRKLMEDQAIPESQQEIESDLDLIYRESDDDFIPEDTEDD